MSLQLLVVLVPVLLAFMGFAFDLGRLYMIRGELNQAASAMALAAAQKLIGTSDSLDKAGEAANQVMDDSTGHGAKYNFGALLVGQSTGMLASEVQLPSYYSALAAATEADDTTTGDEADGTTARHVQINLTAEAPLLFWGLLSLGQSRATPIAARAVAGLSAPVCTACAIEPLAIAALNAEDTTDFGFTLGTKYTLAYQCQSAPPANPPAPLATTGQVISYLLIDRFNDSTELDETQQVYRIGAQGLLPSSAYGKACVQVGAVEMVWGTNGGTSANPSACAAQPPVHVQYLMCGLYTRFLSDMPTVCQNNITDIDNLVTSYQPDTDLATQDDYTAYTGNTRRVITVPIVDALNLEGMNVLGFRQFLLQPLVDGDPPTPFNPNDQDGRFIAMYLGMNQADNLTTPVPLKQGRIDGCQNGLTVAAGPGKVVLHQ
ncbi:MAG: pilus assembly protein TadG-related protein [Bryobacteraceae bacterium]